MRESIFFSALKAFFVSLCAILGICIGFFLIALLLNLFSESTSDPERIYTPEIVANANGVRKTLSKEAPVILQLNIDGMIGLDDLSMETVRRQLIESREGDLKNNRVKAILLRINSPGGTVFDADGIYHALKNYKEQYKVPVYAFVDGLCASGGMYIACAADKIFATESSIVGSIGVISPPFFNLVQLLEKVGVQSLTLYAGKGKDDLNPLRPWKAGEEESIKSIIDFYYNVFVDIVVRNRPEVSRTKLIEEYGAKVFNAYQAADFGLINEAGTGRNAVLNQLLKQIGIDDDYYQVIQLDHKTWYSELFASSWNLLQGKVVHEVKLPLELDMRFSNQFLYLYRPE